jgi:hypothetical protein
MPVDLSSLLSLDAQEREVEVPVDPENPAAGTVPVTIRELPYGVARRLVLRSAGASRAYGAITERLEGREADTFTAEESEALSAAEEDLFEANRDWVRWGVVGHRDVRDLRGPIPFEVSSATFNGKPYAVASERTLRLYSILGGGRPGRPGTLLLALAAAVAKAQRPAEEGAAAGPLATPSPGSSE